jgi:cysteinyl-tRNA synthetase
MSRKYLGDTFDIHTGGVDHIPIHHENEIAQSEALTGKPQADYWMHGEFMQVDGGKMSKSLGNVYTLDELAEKGFSAMHFRFFCLNTHYRKKLNFTFEALQAAKTAYNRLVALLAIHSKGKNKLGEKIQSYENEFLSAINDDINIPLALGVVFSLAKEPFSKEIFEMVARFDKVLGLGLVEAAKKHSTEEKSEEVPQEILLLVQQRMAAKKNRDFALSDKIRDEILAKGYVLIDKKDGYTLTKK